MEKKERNKKLKEVRKYLRGVIEHLGHHCCAISVDEVNRITDILYELEDK